MTKLRLVKGRKPRYVLLYAMRLFPEGTVAATHESAITRQDGSSVSLTPHVIEGTPAQIKRQLARSIDAFFELHQDLADRHE